MKNFLKLYEDIKTEYVPKNKVVQDEDIKGIKLD